MKLLIPVTVLLIVNDFADAIQVPAAWGEPINLEQQPVILKSQIVGLNANIPAGSFNVPQQQDKWIPTLPNSGNNQQFLSLSTSDSPYATSYNQQLQSLNIQPEEIEALQRKYLGKNNEKYKTLTKAKNEEQGKKDAAHKLYLIKTGKIKPQNTNTAPHILSSIPNIYNIHLPEPTKESRIVPLNLKEVRNEYLPDTRKQIGHVLTKNYRDDRTHEPDALDPHLEAITLAKGGKEYRDDKTHEPKDNRDTEKLDYTKEKETQEEETNDDDEETEEAPQNEAPRPEFEVGREVPTKPIYPGPGKWAKPGVKHRPYIQTPIAVPIHQENASEDEKRPDGYDIFEELNTYFNRQRDNFDRGLQQTSQAAKQASTKVLRKQDIPWLNSGSPESFMSFLPSVPVQSAKPSAPAAPILVFNPFEKSQFTASPQQAASRKIPRTQPVILNPLPAQIQKRISHNPPGGTSQNSFPNARNQEVKPNNEETEDSAETEGEDDEEEEFVPTKLYTQVRKTEGEEHLPADPNDSRLREVIKDSKVQTVYSEEGYEDSGYDHEGEEKHAEHDEGEAEHENGEIVKKPTSKGESEKGSYSEDSESEGSQLAPTKATANDLEEPKEVKQHNFIKTKATKTMAVKNKGDGKMEMEISSEVKVFLQPNNSTKAHKYVKIFPKITKDLNDVENIEEDVIKETEVNATQTLKENMLNMNLSNFNNKPTQFNVEKERVNSEHISSTLSPHSKVNLKSLKLENEPIEKVKLNPSRLGTKRNKRFTNDFPAIKIDTEFIDKINHTLPPGKIIIDKTKEKYPYYYRKDINENSPLRYAERLDNIPLKLEGELSFYQQADTKHGCPDIPDGVNPIPKRVKNAKQGVEKPKEESDATPKTPRLRNLGDKIDCLKVRYFGANPLDSPFFKEELVGPVKPIFTELEAITVQPTNIKNTVSSLTKYTMSDSIGGESQAIDETIEDNEIFNKFKENKTDIKNNKTDFSRQNEQAPKQSNNKNSDQVLAVNILADITGHIKNQNTSLPEQNTTSVPVVYFLTTPKYTIDLKPRHIYDQIELLDHLPPNGDNRTDRSDQAEQLYFMEDVTEKTEINSNNRQPKLLVDQPQETLPQQEALRRRKLRPIRPQYSNNYYNVNRFNALTTTGLPIINTKPSTVLPKYKVVSEVFYKDDIKPNEQLTVFADVLNIIKNSPTEGTPPQNLKPKISTEFSVPQIKKTRVKKYQEDSSYNSNTLNTPSPQVTPATEQYFIPTIADALIENDFTGFNNKPIYLRKNNRKRKPTLKSNVPVTTTLRSTTTSRLRVLSPVPADIIDDSTPILGLVPPGNWEYKTIVEPDSDSLKPVTELSDQVQESQQQKDQTFILNTYFVPGMKPPPVGEPFIYSDFLVKDNSVLRRRSAITRHSRVRRSPNRPSYFEFSRNRGQQNAELETTTTKVDDDDYVPHRPKNYYYDEKTGRIVYLKKPEDTITEAEEEVEYVEVIEETPRSKTEKATTKSLLATATPPPAGQGFIDFVAKLKNNENYKFIPDPTTTEKGQLAATSQQVINVVKAEPTTPPEFLNILAKVKSDVTYKEIKDPEDEKKGKKKTTTTEAALEKIEEEEVEETQENVQNSPGGQSVSNDDSLTKLQIFDISDFLPKIKNYSPKTTIDYSKYKTIERPSTRHNLSSRYNLDETENLDEVVTVRKPIILEKDEPSFDGEESSKDIPTLISVKPTEQLPTRTTINPANRRRRPTTLRSNRRSTTSAITSETAQTESSEHREEQVLPHHEKAKRVYRRRPTRIRSTTVKFMDEYDGDSKRVLRKRSEPDSIEVNNEESSKVVDTESPIKGVVMISKKPQDVVIFNKEYDKTKKHGGNYKNEPVSDEAIFSENVKQAPVVVFKEYDKTKKHGGNYKKDEETVSLEKIEKEDEEIERKILEQPEESQQITPQKDTNVVTIKKYDKTRKRGGNYRSSTQATDRVDEVDDAAISESKAGLEQNRDQINPLKNKNLGTNQNSLEKKRETHFRRRYNRNNAESVRVVQDEVKPNKNINNPRRRLRVKPNRNIVKSGNIIPLQRLSDVVPKPEGFYTDPKLPVQVNQLKESKISSEEVEDIVESVEKTEKNEKERRKVKNTPTTKKPLFIKDPGKRLYFYAPV